MWIDLKREKDAVEFAANEFLSSSAPSAATAAYNYDQEAAEQVAVGLFSQRAITGVTIVNDGDVMVQRSRIASPTLPQIGAIGEADEVVLSRSFRSPRADQSNEIIGKISITVDKSLVAPEIVDRLMTFFFVTTAKNVLFGVLLFLTVFGVLTKYATGLAKSVRDWRPGEGQIRVPKLPNLLRGTEVDDLGRNIELLTEAANLAIHDIQVSHDVVVDSNTALSKHSEELSDAVRARTLELEVANQRLKLMAENDGLTGLRNRASFDRTMAEAFRKVGSPGHHVAVLMIDVDHFKAYNDFYGHQAGDDTLVKIAQRLQHVANANDCTVARFGGEEFVAIVKPHRISPEAIAEDMHDAIHGACIEHQHSTVARRITVSIGLASTAEEMVGSGDELVSAADDALYAAKLKGRNQTVVSSPEIRDRAREKRFSVQALLHAIEERAFEPFIQPQVDARTGALIGVEALVRWVRADGKVIAPGSFMQIATDTGLIRKIDVIVLEKISDFLLSNPGALPRLSFNVTGESFENDDYVADIVRLAKSTQTSIAVELLETAFIDRPDERFLWQLDTMREAGIAIEIDDFGTGRTSILGLMAINPDRLKIARELILPLRDRPEQTNLVTSVIEIAKSLAVNVVAEGVETEEISRLLIDIGCPIQQGYHYGRPMPLSDLAVRDQKWA
ncbi:MAG: bifunctional diguanylate cyclase/phosphodiesterase [Pseudomonadota bacterium]